MPANLPPQYFEAEKRFREAKTPETKIECLEEMLTIMPKHKGTDKLRANIRRRISKVRSQSRQKKGASRHESAYSIGREGAAQVVVVGPANVGKSSLIRALTNASPEVAEFPHSTWKPTPGMAPYENIQFQLIDTPPISENYMDPLMADLIRRSDIIIILLDLKGEVLEQFENILALLQDLRIFPKGGIVPEDLEKPPFIKKMFVVVNKVDEVKDQEEYEVFLELTEMSLPSLGISIHSKHNLTALLDRVYEISGIIRVYTKAPGKEPDLNAPFVLPKESTLEDLAIKIHKDFVEKLKYAKVWGSQVFDGQMIQKDYVLQDGDVVEIHI